MAIKHERTIFLIMNMHDCPIYSFDTKESAYKRCSELNEQYPKRKKDFEVWSLPCLFEQL